MSYDAGSCEIIYFAWTRLFGSGQVTGSEGRLSDQCSDDRPDAIGSQAVFMRQVDGQYDIWQNQVGFNVHGAATNLTPNTPTSQEILPVFSPDGKWVAFASNREGKWGLYAIRADSSGIMVPVLALPAGVDFSDWNRSRLSWAY